MPGEKEKKNAEKTKKTSRVSEKLRLQYAYRLLYIIDRLYVQNMAKKEKKKTQNKEEGKIKKCIDRKTLHMRHKIKEIYGVCILYNMREIEYV